VLLEGLWPKFREKLALIQGNIESHKQLMASDVRLEHILQAVDFRRTMLKKIDQVEKAAIESQLKVLRDKFSSPACESSLQSHIDASSSTPGSWVFDKVIFKEWCAGVSPQERCLWIQGIPGAGK
jgi:hypothetical protein